MSASAAIILGLLLWFLLRRRTGGRRLPPGPRPWPIVGNLPHIGPMPHQWMAALAQTHGPLVHLRMGLVDVVVACSAAVAERFLREHDANFSSRPPNAGARYVAYEYQDLVFAPYGPRWRRLRRIAAHHLFSYKALDGFRHVRQEEVGILVGKLANAGREGTAVRIGKMINVCATNAIARAMLGRRVVSHDGDGKAEEFQGMVVELMRLAGVFNIGDFIPALASLDLQGVVGRMKRLHRRFDAFLSTILDEHKADAGGQRRTADLLTTLIGLKDADDSEGGKLTDIEIKALLLNLFVAGTDTTSSTVEWVLAELSRHPKILAQAQQELDSKVGKNRMVTEDDISQLPLLQAIIKENFRLHPSTPLSLPRIAQESCEVNGYFIPKGSTLLVNVWAIGRDPNAWTNPIKFQPERFLPGGERPHADVKGNDFDLIPFGAGRRICAGMSLGIRMVQLLTASLIQAFDWEAVEGLNMEEAYGLTLQRAEPLMVKVKARVGFYVDQP